MRRGTASPPHSWWRGWWTISALHLSILHAMPMRRIHVLWRVYMGHTRCDSQRQSFKGEQACQGRRHRLKRNRSQRRGHYANGSRLVALHGVHHSMVQWSVGHELPQTLTLEVTRLLHRQTFASCVHVANFGSDM